MRDHRLHGSAPRADVASHADSAALRATIPYQERNAIGCAPRGDDRSEFSLAVHNGTPEAPGELKALHPPPPPPPSLPSHDSCPGESLLALATAATATAACPQRGQAHRLPRTNPWQP